MSAGIQAMSRRTVAAHVVATIIAAMLADPRGHDHAPRARVHCALSARLRLMPTTHANFTAAARQQLSSRPTCFAERPLPLHAKPTRTKCNPTDTHHSHLTGTAWQRAPLAQKCKILTTVGGAAMETHPACPQTFYVRMHVHMHVCIYIYIYIHK